MVARFRSVVEKLKWLGGKTLEIAWAAMILLLPITSLPLISRLTGGTMVAPASIIPLVWLTIFWFAGYVARKGTLPGESRPFLLFLSVALISSALAFFRYIPPFKDQSILGEEVSAILTLFIGAAFYLVTAGWLSQSKSRLGLTLKLIDIGGIFLLLLGMIQAVYILFFQGEYPNILLNFQELVSTRYDFHARITSFAFEPSWLAQQLNLVYLPFWLAATITRWSAFRLRIWKFSLENMLLPAGLVILFLSSRIGTLSFLLVVAFLGIYLNVQLGKRLQKWNLSRLERLPSFFRKSARNLLPVLTIFAFVGLYILAAVALVYGLSFIDWRLGQFFMVKSLWAWKNLFSNIYMLLNFLAFAERGVYWAAGWSVFNAHPLFGVGLGNAGFFFQQALPAFSWGLPEVMDTYYRLTTLPNIKSLWIRLLAETGIVGFSSFIAWYHGLFRSTWAARLNQTPLLERSAGAVFLYSSHS